MSNNEPIISDEEPEVTNQAETEDLQKICDELDHKYKLALADYQNLLRQTTKERKDTILYANESLILELLPVYDNLKLSLQHAEADKQQPWFIGISHIIQQFKKLLEETGVKEIMTMDKEFDPITMEAVENRSTSEKDQDGKVAEELKGGYYLHDKVIIPGRVAVYKFTE